MTSAETPAAPSPACSVSGWQRPTVFLLSIVMWMSLGSILTFALNKPKQNLRITNTGSQSVDIRNASDSWWNNKVLTLHPGMNGFWMFRDGDQFRISRGEQTSPKAGTTPPAAPLPSRSESWGSSLTPTPDGSGTIVIEHASRTAEVRVNEAGQIEFEFTDL